MTADDVTFSARCPVCGSDATWRETRGQSMQEGAPAMALTCPACGPSDPVVRLVKALVRNEGAA